MAAFREHWRERHAPLIARLPGIRRYVQNYPVGAEGETAFDAVAESSFDDTQAMKALAKSPEYAAVLADEQNFIDRAGMGSIVTEEQVVKEGPEAGVKRITFVTRPPEIPVEEFFRRWREHGARVATDPAVRRYAQCAVRRSIYESGRTPAFDGAEMAWYDSLEAMNAAPPAAFDASARSPFIAATARSVSIP